MPKGGKRPGSGRKPLTDLKPIHDLLNQNITDDDWLTLFRRLYQLSLDGNMRAADLLLTYRYGNPYAELPEPRKRQIEKIIVDMYSVERERINAQREGRPPVVRPFCEVFP